MSMQLSQLALDISLRIDATMENYLGLAPRMLDRPGETILVWGQPQTGKSHLLQACCHQQRQSIYLSDYSTLSPDMLEGLETLMLVCLDDFSQVLGNRAWEERLFHLANVMRDTGRRLILASEVPAAELVTTLPDLATRLKAAVSVETDALSDDDKLQLLKKRAQSRGFSINDEVGRFILNRAPRDMNSLLGIFERLELETLRQQKTITIPFVKQTLNL